MELCHASVLLADIQNEPEKSLGQLKARWHDTV